MSMGAEKKTLSTLHLLKAQKASPAESSAPDETALWDDFLRGSDSSLAYFYRAYAPRLYNYGRQIINDDDTVSDTIQDLFFDLIRSRSKLSKTTSVKNYLYASLRRKLVRIKEKQALQVRDDSREGKFKISFLKDDQTPLDQFSKEQMRILEEACNELPERQREAIILLYFEEMNYEEIARVMNIGKVRSARALIYRAIDSLKHILDPMKSEFVSLSLILMASLPG